MNRKMNRRVSWKFLAAIASGMSAMKASAGGFQIPDQDAFATARGEAFVATADNASAIYYNPAGITQLDGHNFRAGFYGISLQPSFTQSQAAGGKTFDNQSAFATVPQFFYACKPEQLPVAFGLGIYCPFGLSLKWPQDTGFRTIGTESALTYVRINPVVAFELAPNFSIGGGLTVNYAHIKLGQGLFPVENGDEFQFTGSGWAVGYNLGALWQPHEKISLGLSFRSATTIQMDGSTEVTLPPFLPTTKQDAQTEIKFPWGIVSGISYRPTPKWNIEFDADYTDWSTIQTLVIQQAAPIFPLPQNVSETMDWEHSWLYEFGATRYFENGWHVSAGYALNQNAVPNAHYTPLVADQDKHFLSVGGGFKGKTLEFDVAYQFGYGPTRTVSGSAPSLLGQTADGKYEFISHAVLLTAGLHF
jgi:long-chain fatty acid transport protein